MSMLKSKELKESDKNNWTVYLHRNRINNKMYVGITSRNPETRWQNGTAYKRNPHFNSAIQKYGWDSFDHIILHSCLSADEARQYETLYITQLNLCDKNYGYNMTLGGEGITGYTFTDEQKKRMSENNKGERNPCYGRKGSSHPMFGKRGTNNPNYGRKATEEQRRNMSIGRKGMKFSESHIQHMKDSAKRGGAHHGSVSVTMCSMNGEIIKHFTSVAEASEYSGANPSNIVKCCKNKIKSSMGYVWKYNFDALIVKS